MNEMLSIYERNRQLIDRLKAKGKMNFADVTFDWITPASHLPVDGIVEIKMPADPKTREELRAAILNATDGNLIRIDALPGVRWCASCGKVHLPNMECDYYS